MLRPTPYSRSIALTKWWPFVWLCRSLDLSDGSMTKYALLAMGILLAILSSPYLVFAMVTPIYIFQIIYHFCYVTLYRNVLLDLIPFCFTEHFSLSMFVSNPTSIVLFSCRNMSLAVAVRVGMTLISSTSACRSICTVLFVNCLEIFGKASNYVCQNTTEWCWG